MHRIMHLTALCYLLGPGAESVPHSSHAEPHVLVRGGWVRDEDLRAAVPAAVVPAPAAVPPGRGCELPDVAVHVVNPPGIGAIRTDLHRLREVGSLCCPVMGPIPVE